MRTIHTLLLASSLVLPSFAAVADEAKTDDKYEHLFTQAAKKALQAADRPGNLLSDGQFETLFAAAMARAAAEYDDGRETAQAAPSVPLPSPRP